MPLNSTAESPASAVSLQHLPELFLQAPTPLLIVSGPEHRLEMANDAYARLLRRSSTAELLGRPFRDALPELAGQGVYERLDEVYCSGLPHHGQQEHRSLRNPVTLQMEDAWFDVIYQPLRDADGNSIGLMIQGSDVTTYVLARLRSEERERALTDEWEQLAEMYRTAPVGFAMYEPIGFRMIHVNEKFTEMLNMPAEQMMGRSVLDFAGNIAGVRERYETVAAGGRVENVVIEGVLASQPGVYRCWLVNYTPLFGPDGKVRAISTVSLDITAQKRAETALLQSEKLAAVGRLASSIAHEINNPLESVTNLLYLSTALATDPEQLRYLTLADEELRRVAVIANQTLRFHKQLSRPVCLRAQSLFTAVQNIFEGRFRNSRIALEPRLRTDDEVLCLDGEIRQVMSNLVGNAVDAMNTGGTLHLRARSGTDWRSGQRGLVITVADTGAGMDAATRARVFEAFFTTKGIGGTGLGLWISEEIVQRHHGRLLLRSSQQAASHGTVVTLFLPFGTLPPNPPRQTAEASLQPDAEEPVYSPTLT